MSKLQLHRRTPQNPKGNLLYLMGATWKTKSMFDLDSDQESFCQILNNNGIETFAFDIPETSHDDVLNITFELIETHNIKNVMGYSYGCITAFDAAFRYKLDNVILLDPFSGTQIKNEEFDTHYEYNTSDVKTTIDEVCSIPESVKECYLSSLGGSKFNSPKYPKLKSRESYNTYTSRDAFDTLQGRLTVNFTDCVKQEVYEKYSMLNPTMYNSSHWILLESGRQELAKNVLTLIRH